MGKITFTNEKKECNIESNIGGDSMIETNFRSVFDKFELRFFRKIFELVRERDGSLSAMEAFSLEVIKILGTPTVGQFADFLKISQSNATYKVNTPLSTGGSIIWFSPKSITTMRICSPPTKRRSSTASTSASAPRICRSLTRCWASSPGN